MTPLRVLTLYLALGATAADARPMFGDRWPVAGQDRDADCELVLRSNPVVVRIEASGFIPGERLLIVVRNGAMKPIRATFLANREGRFSEYYAPLKSRFGAPISSGDEGGKVDVEISAARCSVSASSPWTIWRPTIP